MKPTEASPKIILGWREWFAFPELGIPGIKAKLDTGARTSALHATGIETFDVSGQKWVNFKVHPLQRKMKVVVHCQAEVIDRRVVTDSGGHSEERWVIRTPICLGEKSWPVEVTLTEQRINLKFRMLLGRTAMDGAIIVDPSLSFVEGRALGRSYTKRRKIGEPS